LLSDADSAATAAENWAETEVDDDDDDSTVLWAATTAALQAAEDERVSDEVEDSDS